jgi:hypothetical protein
LARTTSTCVLLLFSLRGRISQVSEERPIHRPNEKRTRRREPDEGTLAAQSTTNCFSLYAFKPTGEGGLSFFSNSPKRNSSLILEKRKRQDFFFLGCSIDISRGKCIHIQLWNRLFFRPVLLHPTIFLLYYCPIDNDALAFDLRSIYKVQVPCPELNSIIYSLIERETMHQLIGSCSLSSFLIFFFSIHSEVRKKE